MKITRRIFVLLLIIFLTLTVIYRGDFRFFNLNQTGYYTNFPNLKALKTLKEGGIKMGVENGKGYIKIALELPETLASEDMASDMTEVYRWGRSHFTPYKCGPDYSTDLCDVGYVWIILVQQKTTITQDGWGTRYVMMTGFYLDQFQIDRLLMNPRKNMTEILDFHDAVMTNNINAGAVIFPTEAIPFDGYTNQ